MSQPPGNTIGRCESCRSLQPHNELIGRTSTSANGGTRNRRRPVDDLVIDPVRQRAAVAHGAVVRAQRRKVLRHRASVELAAHALGELQAFIARHASKVVGGVRSHTRRNDARALGS